MRKIAFTIILLLLVCRSVLGAISLTADSVSIQKMQGMTNNYYVVVYAHNNSREPYVVTFDIYPGTSSVIGSFSTANKTIDYYYSGLKKNNAIEYFCTEESQVSISIEQINQDSCRIVGHIEAERKYQGVWTMYYYDIKDFTFAYHGDEPDDPTLDPYRFEPQTAASWTFHGDVIRVENKLADGWVNITLNAIGDSTYHWIDLNLITDTFAMPMGTYVVSSNQTKNTLTASKGYVSKNDDPCFVAIRGHLEDWGQYTPYYIINGSLTFSLNGKGDTVYVAGTLTSKHGSQVTVKVQSYNMFYTPEEEPKEPEHVELAIDSVVITYLRLESDSAANEHHYSFDFFSTNNDNYPAFIVDAILPMPNQLTAGTYSLQNSNLVAPALYQNQQDFEEALWGGHPYIFKTCSMILSPSADSVWQYAVDITDSIGSHYWFTLNQRPHIVVYPSLEPDVPEDDKPYIDEKKEQITQSFTFNTLLWDDSSVARDGVIDISLFEGQYDQQGLQYMAELGLYAASAYVTDSVYPVNATDLVNTFCASMGKIGNIVIPCYIAQRNSTGYVYQIWYLTEGTIQLKHIDVQTLLIEGQCTSYFGSNISFRYQGSFTTDLETPCANAVVCKKVVRNHRVEILRNGERYSLLGIRL